LSFEFRHWFIYTFLFQVSAVAPPGYVLMIEQTVGTCDHSTVQTDMFRISHVDKAGGVVKESYKRFT
jgi:hypothetical protein